MKRVFGLCVGAVLFTATSPVTARAEPAKAIEASASGVGSTAQAACEDARKRAMREAVERAAGVFVASDTVVKDALFVRDTILTRAQGFVSEVKVLEQRATAVRGDATQQECTLRISARVEASKAADALKKVQAALAAKGRPKILLMIAEQAVGMSGAAGWWTKDAKAPAAAAYKSTDTRQVETKMMQLLAAHGFSFIDPETLTGKLKLVGPVSADPSDRQVREIGKLAEAQVVIYGHAAAEEPTALPSELVGNTKAVSVSSKISARAVATDSGDIYATYTGQATAPGYSPLKASANSFDRLADKAATELEKTITERWLGEAFGTQRVDLTVNGVKDYRTLVQLKAALSTGTGIVQEVTQRSHEDGKARLDLRCTDSAEKLADALSSTSFQGHALRIDKVTANTLVLTLVPARK